VKIGRIIDTEENVTWVAQQDDGSLLRVVTVGEDTPPEVTEEVVEVRRWLPPVEPRAILCIGLNYRQHAAESDAPLPEWPVLFMKNPAAAIGHAQPIIKPAVCEDELDYECELAVVIGKACKDVSADGALAHVLGYTVANDVSARIWQQQKGGGQWVRGKSFDTFAPMGPVLVTPDQCPDTGDLALRTLVNGEVMQDSTTADMVFDVPTLVSFLSQDTTLLPGTVILTGTPGGVGWARDPKTTLNPGDTVSVEIDGIGRLTNPVQAAVSESDI